MKTAYKVVFVGMGRDGFPTRRSIYDSKHSVEYGVGVWCTAPIGGLLCFDNFDDAKRYMSYVYRAAVLGAELWECEVDGKVDLPPGHFGYMRAESAWNRIYCMVCGGKCLCNRLPWPVGTCAFKREISTPCIYIRRLVVGYGYTSIRAFACAIIVSRGGDSGPLR